MKKNNEAKRNTVVDADNFDDDGGPEAFHTSAWDDPAYFPVIAEIIQFKDKSLINKPFGPLEVIGFDEIPEEMNKFPGSHAYKWIFRDTNGKTLSCIFGQVTDKNLVAQGIAIGDSILFTFLGKKQLDSGNSVNTFDIRLRMGPDNANRRGPVPGVAEDGGGKGGKRK